MTGGCPIGALLGGLAGEWLGIEAPSCLARSAPLSAAVFVLLSPFRHVRELPSAPEIGDAAQTAIPQTYGGLPGAIHQVHDRECLGEAIAYRRTARQPGVKTGAWE